MPLFLTRSPESLLKFGIPHNKIIHGQNLSTGPQGFGMTRILGIVESLRVFEQKAREREAKKNANFELVMKYIIYHFFPPKVLQRQKRYLRRSLYKLRNTKIQSFICRIDEMVKYLENFPPFGA